MKRRGGSRASAQAKRFDRIGVYEKEDIPDGMSEADLKRTSTERRVAAQHQVAELAGEALASKMGAPHRLLLTLVTVPVLGRAVRPLLQRHAAKQQSAAPARPAVDEVPPRQLSATAILKPLACLALRCAAEAPRHVPGGPFCLREAQALGLHSCKAL